MPPGAPLDVSALAAARAELEARLLAELPAGASAVAIGTLGLLAFLFFLRERSRRDMLLYALFSCGIALYLSGGIQSFEALRLATAIRVPLLTTLAFALPVTGLLFVHGFLRLRLGLLARVLLVVPAAGIVLALFPRLLPGLPRAPLAGLSLGALAAALLGRLATTEARRRKDTALLFVGTSTLLLAALFDGARASGILLAGPRYPTTLGPAFLVFTALLLVAVADEGRRLLARATTDPLTNLANRAEFLVRAGRELVRAGRTERPFAIAMLDLDHFKEVNDRFGHPAGDRVLSAAAHAIAETLRGVDLCGRYGGEEFVLLLVEVDEPSAIAAVERVRDAIGALAPPKVPTSLTVSAGIAVHHPLFERASILELIKRADAALYESKRGGRDRSTLDGAQIAPPATVAEVRIR